MWILFSILAAFFKSGEDVASKKALVFFDAYATAWGIRTLTFLFLLPLAITIPFPPLGRQFFLALFAGGSLNVLATILYIKALQRGDLSNTVPMTAFTPVFLLLTSPVIIGEFPDLQGVIGILFIVAGSYGLNLKEKQAGFWKPLASLWRRPGPRYMLAVAFIWSISSNFDKIGITQSSTIFWILILNAFGSIAFLPFVFFKIIKKDELIIIGKKRFFPRLLPLIAAGIFSVLLSVFQMEAIKLNLVTYVIAIKRASVIFTIIWGGLLFREKDIIQRLIGGIIIIFGVFLIAV